nr:SDR family oxidoreductase [Actinomycetota bacterium]
MRIAVAGGTGMVGRYVTMAAEQRGHQVVVISRARGVDLRTGKGLDGALEGVEVIIDVTNVVTTNKKRATAFFTEVAGRLATVGADRGVHHVVTLSIVGLERTAGYGYYQAKLCHEQAALAGPVPATVLRATQFHEFASQILARTRRGPLACTPTMWVQPVAARTVGVTLIDLAVSEPVGMAGELAGPEPAALVSLARALLRQRGERVAVLSLPLPGAAGKAMRNGALLPGPGARLEGPTFEQWLTAP